MKRLSLNNKITSNIYTLKDVQTSTPFYTLTPSSTNINEGETLTITFNTNQEGTFGYEITGISASDLSGTSSPLIGNFTSNGEVLTLNLLEDLTTEGSETITVTLPTLNVSTTITVNDTSTEPATYNLTTTSAGVNEQNSIFTISFTTNQPGSFPYTISGVDSNDISNAPLTGTIANGDSITYTTTPDLTTEGIETFLFSLDNGQASVSVSIFDSSTTPSVPPTLDVNEGFSLGDGTIFIITTTILSASDADNFPSNIYFNLTQVPTNGVLTLNGTTLNVGDSFRQLDLNNNNVQYENTLGGGETSDSFQFTLSDLQNNDPTVYTVNITVVQTTLTWRTIINDYSNLTGAYSSTFLMDNTVPINTPALRIKNISTGVETDISFGSDRRIDEAALNSAISTGTETDIRCITWYNQTTGVNDFTSHGIDTRNPYVQFNANKRDNEVLLKFGIPGETEHQYLQLVGGIADISNWTIYFKYYFNPGSQTLVHTHLIDAPYDPNNESTLDNRESKMMINQYFQTVSSRPNGISPWSIKSKNDDTTNLTIEVNPGNDLGTTTSTYLRDNTRIYKVVALCSNNGVLSCTSLYSPDEQAIHSTKYGYREVAGQPDDNISSNTIYLGSLKRLGTTINRSFTSVEFSVALIFNDAHSQATMKEILDRLLED